MAYFNYTICHPDKQEIETSSEILSHAEALEMARNYPWAETLSSMDGMDPKSIHYSPSLEFINQSDKRAFTLTATLEGGKPEFSLWYVRMVPPSGLSKLFGGSEKKKISDSWGYDLESALKYLESFLNEDYSSVEGIYKN